MNLRRTTWRDLDVWAYERPSVFAFTGERRLTVLRLWRAGQRLPLVWFTCAAAEVSDRASVDWTGFPDPEGSLAPG